MTATPYTILAIFVAKPGKEEVLKEVLTTLIAPTLKEEGCVNYDLHQSLENPAKFMFYENWADKAAHTLHSQTPHLQAWREVKAELLDKPADVSAWEKV